MPSLCASQKYSVCVCVYHIHLYIQISKYCIQSFNCLSVISKDSILGGDCYFSFLITFLSVDEL